MKHNPRKIKSLLVLNGITQKQIADSLGLKKTTVSTVIAGNARSRRIQEAIAKALDVPYAELWGGFN